MAPTTLVVSEHPDHLTDERRAGYGRMARTLAEASGGEVETVHYLDASDLRRAGAVVVSGSKAPWAAHDGEALDRFRSVLWNSGRPTLGICAGLQLLVEAAGGRVRPMTERGAPPERGYRTIEIVAPGGLLDGLPASATVFQDHEDEVVDLPPALRLLARSDGSEVQAFEAVDRPWWGTQFHPERYDGEHPAGGVVLRNFFALAGR